MKRNKGFSLVEMIIVVAIMAILAASLAPSLIKFINKSRLAKDLDSGRKLAHAIMATLTDESAYDDAVAHSTPYAVDNMDNTAFKVAVFDIMDMNKLGTYAKRDINGDPFPTDKFYYTLDPTKNQVEIYFGDVSSDYMVYPNVGAKMAR